MHDGNFVVTYESIIPQLGTLREYKPLMQEFWRDGPLRRARRALLPTDQPRARSRRRDRLERPRRLLAVRDVRGIFRAGNVRQESYFDSMTHFDFKTLLPALLHVEDRVSMAHGLESRVPVRRRRHRRVRGDAARGREVQGRASEARAEAGHARRAPAAIVDRRDKMGFPCRSATG